MPARGINMAKKKFKSMQASNMNVTSLNVTMENKRTCLTIAPFVLSAVASSDTLRKWII
jgi:hypothetical protein